MRRNLIAVLGGGLALVAILLGNSQVTAAVAPSAEQAFPKLQSLSTPINSIPVPTGEFARTFRSVSLDDLIARDIAPLGIYTGSPKVRKNQSWYDAHFYATLGSKKIWDAGSGPLTQEMGDPITWRIMPDPGYAPPPCDQPQPTGYDAQGCHIANSLFKDVALTDPAKAARLRELVRRGRDVWFKGTFGNQDLNDIHLARTIGHDHMYYPWLDTRTRDQRFSKWGLINDPDCHEGSAASNWYDVCEDPQSSGVLGYRKYLADPVKDASGKVVFDPATSPYRKDEIKKQLRYKIGSACVQCHVSFNPTRPPADPNHPQWENLSATIGNKYIVQPTAFIMGTPEDSPVRQVLRAGRKGTIDTSLNPNDFQNNPGTQNNIMDFMNRRVFAEHMKDPFTGKISVGKTQHVLKGGEDSVGDRLALLRVYVNIGMCSEECWVPNFPRPGTFFGEKSRQHPFRIKQCARDCEDWNYADAKMPELESFLITAGPTYLMRAKDVDGKSGASFIDFAKVPRGHTVFARECARCHSSVVPPDSITNDKDALEAFYKGHVFGKQDYWQYEFTDALRNSDAFKQKYLARDASGQLVPRQFAEKGMFGQDWLGNDNPTPFKVIGTNMCRALHDNHNAGHIFAEFSSEDFKQRPSPGSVARVFNRMLPWLGGKQFGTREITGGPGYLRNISLLSVWATAPFLHNNAIGDLTYLPDGTADTSVAGSVKQFDMAFARLMESDDQSVTPHRPEKITRTDRDIEITPREDMQGWPHMKVPKGTPIAYFTSLNPHRPLFQKCDDLIENKGHQFGVDLSAGDKLALREFLKLM